MANLIKWIAPACLAAAAFATQPDDALFGALLSSHVGGGLVDYAGLRADPRLGTYLAQLAASDPASLPSDKARLALWLNAYNAYTIKLIVDNPSARSIVDVGAHGLVIGTLTKSTAWDIRFARVGGRTYTLNEIEHEIIRRQFGDFRSHFALNCASASCPVLRPEAYRADTIDRQLDDQALRFLRDGARNRFELASRTAWLSPIFKWYREDFGRGERDVLLVAARYAPDPVKASIEADPASWVVHYLNYDWSLNAARP